MFLADHAGQLDRDGHVDRKDQADQDCLQRNHHYMIMNRYKLCHTMRWIYRILRYGRDEAIGV